VEVISILVMRASAGATANNAVASDATKEMLKVRMQRRTAKK
jgi:hypothetical protein